ncbi:MAG: hypothetical protein O2975_02510 [Proteobacteria bacterium]|nr:hypothetical protein [Pseudomonadota bacterium]
MSERPGGPGRACPIDYRYGAHALGAPATLATETLWIAGGLYGNPFALERLESMLAAEQGEATLVFNGDFHWFDVDDAAFETIEAGVARHLGTRGNVETELAKPQDGAGCGCGYPDWVDDADVARSNRIIERLRATAARAPRAIARLAALPMFRIAEVGGMRVAIVHGDAASLSGWGFSQESLATAGGVDAALQAFDAARVSLFASSHTCLPVLQAFAGARAIINNGAAGMPNFSGQREGLVTRVSVHPARNAVYGMRLGALYVDAVPLAYDARAWEATFLAQWPQDSDAHASYYARIVNGPHYTPREAQRFDEVRRKAA